MSGLLLLEGEVTFKTGQLVIVVKSSINEYKCVYGTIEKHIFHSLTISIDFYSVLFLTSLKNCSFFVLIKHLVKEKAIIAHIGPV